MATWYERIEAKSNKKRREHMFRKFMNREEGQSLAEYALILALIAVVAIVALQALGGGIVTQLEAIVAAF
jgi:Flp pilus assembly pilin Flp